MVQMKEQIKAPEKIQLSDEEIANLSDAEFKTLVNRMLTEIDLRDLYETMSSVRGL